MSRTAPAVSDLSRYYFGAKADHKLDHWRNYSSVQTLKLHASPTVKKMLHLFWITTPTSICWSILTKQPGHQAVLPQDS